MPKDKRVKQWHALKPGCPITDTTETYVLPARIDLRESLLKGEFVKDDGPVGTFVAYLQTPYQPVEPVDPYPRFFNPEGGQFPTAVVRDGEDYHVAHATGAELTMTMLPTTKGVVVSLMKDGVRVSERLCPKGEEIETVLQLFGDLL